MATLGEKRVRMAFNPSGNDLVDEIKRRSAELIDLCDSQKSKDAEIGRLWALAMTHGYCC